MVTVQRDKMQAVTTLCQFQSDVAVVLWRVLLLYLAVCRVLCIEAVGATSSERKFLVSNNARYN